MIAAARIKRLLGPRWTTWARTVIHGLERPSWGNLRRVTQLVDDLDDIVDAIDALVKRMPLFHVKSVPSGFVKQTEVLLAASRAVDEAVTRLRKSRKLSDLSDKLIEIHHQESVGDDNHHAAMSDLFSGEVEPLEVLKWKELYDYIEEAIDGCEDVGNTLERIVLKNG